MKFKFCVIAGDYENAHATEINILRIVCEALNFYHGNQYGPYFDNETIGFLKGNNIEGEPEKDDFNNYFDNPDQAQYYCDFVKKIEKNKVAIVDMKGVVNEYNLSAMGDFEKLLLKLVFNDDEINEDRVKVVSDIIKSMTSKMNLITKFFDKSFPHVIRKIGFTRFTLTRILFSILDDAMTKYIKAHKSDFEIKGPVCLVRKYENLFPIMESKYVYTKGACVILAPESKDSKTYKLYPITKPEGQAVEDQDPFDDQYPFNYVELMAVKVMVLSALQDGSASYRVNKNGNVEVYFTEENLDSFIRLAKRVTEDKVKLIIGTSVKNGTFNLKGREELIVDKSMLFDISRDIGIYINKNEE
jgi:hypothetical protein